MGVHFPLLICIWLPQPVQEGVLEAGPAQLDPAAAAHEGHATGIHLEQLLVGGRDDGANELGHLAVQVVAGLEGRGVQDERRGTK